MSDSINATIKTENTKLSLFRDRVRPILQDTTKLIQDITGTAEKEVRESSEEVKSSLSAPAPSRLASASRSSWC